MSKKLNKAYFNDWIWKDLANYSNRIEVYYGGAGSGKSFGACQKVLLKAMNNRRKVLVIRKIQRTIRDSIWELFMKLLRQSGFYAYTEINKSEFRFELPNGSLFLFKGLDDEEKIKSIEGITDIIIEEATELVENDYTQLNLRLRPSEKDPQIYLMFNPISKANWVYTYFFENGAPENCKIVQTNYQDNRFLPAEYKQELERLKERNPAYYKIYVEGEFATLDKLVFPVFTRKIISADETTGLKRWIGLDFGYTNDPSALVWGFIDEKVKRIYVAGEYVKRGMLNDEIAKVMKDLGLQKDKTYADAAEPKSIAEIKREGINIEATEKGPDSIIHGIQWLLQYELIVDERCFSVITELENYTWKKDKKTGEYINEPVDTYNHTIDAMRYGLNRYIKGKTEKARVKDKARFGIA